MHRAHWLGIRAETWIYNCGMISTMALCGIWHGSSLTFLLWGLFHGFLLSVEHAFLRRGLKKIWWPVANLWTLLLVMLGWVLFRSDSFSHAMQFFKALAGLGTGDGRAYYPALYLDNRVLLALAAAIIGAWPIKRLVAGKGPWGGGLQRNGLGGGLIRFAGNAVIFALFLVSLMVMAGDKYSPFLYVRF
jgi:alginate O-acetyltransferase complex protein AlgI